jgi:hypothetical protein
MITLLLSLSAFCYDFNYPTNGPGFFANPPIWQVEDDCADWQGVIDSPIIDCTTATAATYYKPVLTAAVEAASANWSRFARLRARTGFGGFATPLNAAVDGISSISVSGSEDPSQFAANAGFAPGGECGLRFRAVTSLGGTTTFKMHDDDQAPPMSTSRPTPIGSASSFERTIAHEMGHCFGVSHPHACTTSACDANGVLGIGQLMNQNGCGVGGKWTDVPHPDDGYGHHFTTLTGTYALPRRRIYIQRVSYSSTNAFNTAAPTATSFYAAYPPRVDCTRSPARCAIATVSGADGNTLSLRRMDMTTTPPTLTSTNSITMRSRGTPDVATGEGVVVMVAQTVVSTTGLANTGDQMGSLQIFRFDAASATFLESFNLQTTNDNTTLTYLEPRIAHIDLIDAAPCGSLLCQAGSFCPAVGSLSSLCLAPSTTFGRFVVATVDPSRTLRLYISGDPAGNGTGNPERWTPLTISGPPLAQFNNNILPPVDDNFEFSCPSYVSGTGSTLLNNVRTCRLLLPTVGTASLDGKLTECRVQISPFANVATVLGCSLTTGLATHPAAFPGGMIQTGPDGDATHRASAGWVVSLPLIAHTSATNSEMLLFNSGGTSALGNIVTATNTSADGFTCNAQGSSLPRTYSGGVDIAQTNGSMVRVLMGEDFSTGVGTCW